jgi:hypothetical protein
MTAAQIEEILGSGLMDVRVPLNDINFISFTKDKHMIFAELARTRFFFDTTNQILEVSFCRPYSRNLSETPAHGEYDQYEFLGEQVIFEYLVDSDENIIKDYYTFDSINIISLK